MADFLLELRCEEIPARMQKGARASLARQFRDEMKADGVEFDDLTVWSTPRRLALIARGLPTETAAVSDEVKGPPVGAPDQAIDGFCRKNGVGRGNLEVREIKGRETYFAVIEKPGQAVKNILAPAINPLIAAGYWPKSMRWGDASIRSNSLKWVRPLSGIVALFDGEVVEHEFEGFTTGRTTFGHRFHSTGEIEIAGADDYAAKLRDAHVIVDHAEREAIVREGARKAASDAGLVLVEDEGLVVENAGLTEWPVPLLGRFEDDFLDVPPETIQLTARVNQKYFVCEDAAGTLANAFICTANIVADDPAVVVDGNRKVLAARLADARFFWELDQKKALEQHAEGLKRITFHEKLGTVADKVDRVAKLARWLCEKGIVKPCAPAKAGAQSDDGLLRSQEITKDELADLAEQAAQLCKADLVTEMVGEFPELQGLMGGYYADKEGLPVEVSDAIRDHYKPVGQGDDVPTAPVTVAVSLADKLDTLSAFFEIGEKPTGSKDPYALRRAAIGVITLATENGLRIPLLIAIRLAMGIRLLELKIATSETTAIRERLMFSELGNIDNLTSSLLGSLREAEQKSFKAKFESRFARIYELAPELLDFFADRLKVQQREAGVRHDLIDAVFALGGEDDLVRLLARVKALQSFIETDNGANLLAGYKRAANILKKEEWVAPKSTDGKPLSYMPETAEKALIDALADAAPKAASAVTEERFEDAMAALATLRGPIDAFFEDVTVNDDAREKREARLNLLARFTGAVGNVADFSRIEG